MEGYVIPAFSVTRGDEVGDVATDEVADPGCGENAKTETDDTVVVDCGDVVENGVVEELGVKYEVEAGGDEGDDELVVSWVIDKAEAKLIPDNDAADD